MSARLLIAAVVLAAALSPEAAAQVSPETWSMHGQATFVDQYHPTFDSPYRGPNSLDPGSRGDETFDATLFAGVRLWDGAEAYANLEIDQGFGLSNTLGVAGFTSAEAYKVGKATPYARLQRLFLRQTIDVGGDEQDVAADANQLGGHRAADNLTITAGKFSVTDVFDTNTFAHDPKQDFLNWSIIDSGAFDYAADAWGYSYGIAAEWTQGWWTLRAGLFDLSRVPNSTELGRGFEQFEAVGEFEARYSLFGKPGKLKIVSFVNCGRMGSYDDAIALAQSVGTNPDTALVRRYASKPGAAVNLEQPLSDDLGVFLRASFNDGSKEAYEFTEINRSVSFGSSLKGTAWSRPDDAFGMAVGFNALSNQARAYFAAGGLGILIGDGQLPHYSTEDILEAYYSAKVAAWLQASVDYQLVINPAYNRDRGPVSVFSLRLHSQI